MIANAAPRIMGFVRLILPVMALGLLFAPPRNAAAGQESPTAEELLRKTVEAVGGWKTVSAVQTLSFKIGPQTYIAAADGRLKVKAGLEASIVYEAVLVAGGTVRRNTLNRTVVVAGAEAVRWSSLARFLGGVFTPRLFPGPFEIAGTRRYGPARHHILTTREAGAEISFSVDAEDFLVKRMVLRVPRPGEDPYELSCEFADTKDVQGLKIPSTIFFSQVGVGGTGTPGARPVTDAAVNPPLPPGTFEAVEVNAGVSEAAPGFLKGQILYGFGYDDERIAIVFTNWGREEIERAGFKPGDRIAVRLDDFEYEATFFTSEDEANVEGAYDPGRAMLTLWPSRAPMYHLYFSIMPKDLYDLIRSKSVALRPLEARSKS